MPDLPTDHGFATCPRGLEGVLAAELAGLGASDIRPAGGGASFIGDKRTFYRANLESRIATRILLRVAEGPYRDEKDVYALAHGVAWHRRFNVDQTIRVDVNATRSPLRSLEFATLRIKDAVCDRFRAERGERPSVDTRSPDVRIAGYLDERTCSLYVDTSGEPLYKRGLRGRPGEAPLRENLAAGIIALSGWKPEEPFLDPMCGSGTFLVEAALLALGIAPGAGRSFGFERLREFDAALWRGVRDASRQREQPRRELAIFGADVSREAVSAARATLAGAGLANVVQIKQADVLELEPPAPWGVMVANPPYGVRIGEEDALARFYPKLGDALKARFAGWRCYFFTGDLRLAKLIGLKATKRTPLFNGPLECRLFEYRIMSGSMRKGHASPERPISDCP